MTQPKHRMSDIEQPKPRFNSIREVEEEQLESLVGKSQQQQHRRTLTGKGGFEMELGDLRNEMEEHKISQERFSHRKQQIESLVAIEEQEAAPRKGIGSLSAKGSVSTRSAAKIPRLNIQGSVSRQRTASTGKVESKYKPYEQSPRLGNLKYEAHKKVLKPISRRGSTPIVQKPGKQLKTARQNSSSRMTSKASDDGKKAKAHNFRAGQKPPQPQKL